MYNKFQSIGSYMSSRHLLCVYHQGAYQIAQFGVFDGYPGVVAAEVIDFLNQDKSIIKKFKSNLKNCCFLTEQELNNQTVFKKNPTRTNTASNILSIITKNRDQPIYLKNSLYFAAESLYCEWLYVIDFDKNTFEIFKGFNEDPLHQDERFYNLTNSILAKKKQYPVKLAIAYGLENLPTLSDCLDYLNDDDE